MRTSSRWMPERDTPSLMERSFSIAVLVGIFALMAWASWFLAAAVVVFFLVDGIPSGRRLARVAAERERDSICTFARALDARSLDPWVIRGVYEELSDLCGFPVRADDHFTHDLEVDWEDFEDAVVSIAARIGRDLAQAEENPHYPQMASVRDLALFLDHQPRQALALA